MAEPDTSSTSVSMLTSPLWPLVLLVVGSTMLALEGTTPYRIWWRLEHWKETRATLLSTYERRVEIRPRGQGPSEEYLARRPQQRVFERQVERGWPLTRKEKLFEVRLSYAFVVGQKSFTRVSDVAPRAFDDARSAELFVSQRIEKGRIKVWYDPAQPDQASAFLDVQSFRWVRLGGTFAILAVIWLLLLAWRRAVQKRLAAEAAQRAQEAQEEAQEVSKIPTPARRRGRHDPGQ
jgi:hypothetical protein